MRYDILFEPVKQPNIQNLKFSKRLIVIKTSVFETVEEFLTPQSSPNWRGTVNNRSGHKAVNNITGAATKIMSFSARQTVS